MIVYKVDPRAKGLPSVVTATISGEFTDTTLPLFVRDMRLALETGQEIIPILINSTGGYMNTLLGLIDMMDWVKSKGVKVATVCMGEAASSAAVIVTHGSTGFRYCSPGSTFMIHSGSSATEGTGQHMAAEVTETTRLDKYTSTLMSRDMGQEDSFIDEQLTSRAGADWYVSARQAKKLGMVDHIRIPTLTVTVVPSYKLR